VTRPELQAALIKAEDSNSHNPSRQLLFLAGFKQHKVSLQLQHSKQLHLLSCQHLPLLVLLLLALHLHALHLLGLHLLGLLLLGQLLLGQLLSASNKNKLLKEISMQTDLVAHQEEHRL